MTLMTGMTDFSGEEEWVCDTVKASVNMCSQQTEQVGVDEESC